MRSRKHLTKVKYFFSKQELAVVAMVGDVVCVESGAVRKDLDKMKLREIPKV